MTTPNNTPTQTDIPTHLPPQSATSLEDSTQDGSKVENAPDNSPHPISSNIQNQDLPGISFRIATLLLQFPLQFSRDLWQRLTLRAKATVVGIALGTSPVLLVGGIGTHLASQDIMNKTLEDRQRLAATISLQMKDFVRNRLYDLEEIANAPIVVDASVRQAASANDILKYLDSYLERDPTYSAIVAVQPDGGYAYLDDDNTIPFMVRQGKIPPEAYQPAKKPFVETQVPYFLKVIDTRLPTVSPLQRSTVTGQSFFHMAVPAFKASASELAYVIYSQISAVNLSNLMTEHVAELLEKSGNNQDNTLAQFSLIDHSVAYFERTTDGKENEIPANRIEGQGNSIKIDGQPFQASDRIFTKINRIFVSNEPEHKGVEIATIFPAYKELYETGVAATAIQVSLEDGKRYLLTYIPISQVEQLAVNWGVLLYEPAAEVFAPQRTLILILLVVALVAATLMAGLGAYFSSRAIQPILAAADTVAKLRQGNLDARVTIKGGDELAALGENINQMAVQIQNLLTAKAETTQQLAPIQEAIAARQQQWSDALQAESTLLLHDLNSAISGDLTVQTQVTTGEVGSVGDLFNTMVTHLREMLISIKQATVQVNMSVGENQGSMRQLSDEALAQVEQITHILNSVAQISTSIRTVADSTREAAEVAHNASIAAQAGDTAMDRAVENILSLRSTVADTTKKVKQLGEAAQEISQVSSLINEIAMKTNLLAVNASIGATHAGDEGQGFDVVAGEVGDLAEQVAVATQKIEQIVQNIQASTREVVKAMEIGATQVVAGTDRVQEVKQTLVQILAVSNTVDQLLQSLSEATTSQAETSQALTLLMRQITQTAEHTSDSSQQVAEALQETMKIGRELETAVDQFKIDAEAV